jgi:hypothetical protein
LKLPPKSSKLKKTHPEVANLKMLIPQLAPFSRPKKVLNNVYSSEKCLLDLDPLELYAYQLVFTSTFVNYMYQ